MSLILKKVYIKKINHYNEGICYNLSTLMIIRGGHLNLLKQRNLHNDWIPDFLNIALKNNQTEIVDYIYKIKDNASVDYLIYLSQYSYQYEIANYFRTYSNSWQMNILCKMAEQFGHDTLMRIILWLRLID